MHYYKRMLHDHLKSGKYDNADENLRKETESVSNANNTAEGEFIMLDRLIREKPNYNIITFEAIIMSRNNKTSEWKKSLTQE